MADPLDALRTAAAPVAPDPTFARRLRARVERALSPTGGPAVSTILTEPAAATPAAAAPATGGTQPQGVVPFLSVADARRAIEWYVDALGAELRGAPFVMPDGRIGHSELWIGGGPFHVSDESPASHVAAPRPGADATVTLGAEVPDVDAVITRAVARGATLERAAADYSYGRNAVIRDPEGHRWLLSSSLVADRVRNGDVAYASLHVPDVERAADFFAAVLGWTYAPGSAERGRQVTNTPMPMGLWGGVPESTLLLSYFVDGVDSAIVRVRDAGGAAEAPRRERYGYTVDCTDIDGVRFSMLEIAGPATSRAASAAPGHGALTYITMEVADTAQARAFYGAVFGWDFTAGNWPDGWNVVEPVPMTGMAGGRGRGRNLPVYQVDDVAAAAQRVRDLGGTASGPDRRPYGVMSDCTSPDGVMFALWEP
ncbi:MAG TPA: VOC family protein [Candidatus Dormibacteraeota bacterium]